MLINIFGTLLGHFHTKHFSKFTFCLCDFYHMFHRFEKFFKMIPSFCLVIQPARLRCSQRSSMPSILERSSTIRFQIYFCFVPSGFGMNFRSIPRALCYVFFRRGLMIVLMLSNSTWAMETTHHELGGIVQRAAC